MSKVAVHRTTQLTGIAPQFLVDDLDRAIAYYRNKLGFELDFENQSFYASVTRDGFAIQYTSSMRRNWSRTENTGSRTNIWTHTFRWRASELCSASCKCVGQE
jgi:catechol 2,3-dioxygenase-like lactoylglutathione lyase family enzyme